MARKMKFSESNQESLILNVTHPFMTEEDSLASRMTVTDKRQCVNGHKIKCSAYGINGTMLYRKKKVWFHVSVSSSTLR